MKYSQKPPAKKAAAPSGSAKQSVPAKGAPTKKGLSVLANISAMMQTNKGKKK